MKRLILLITIFFLSTSALFSQDFRPGDHEYLFTPTAYTMPKGTAYFTDYELILLNFTYAVTNSTHIGIFTPFPVSTEMFDLLSIGVKQKYINTEKFKMALFGSYTFDSSILFVGNAISIGEPGNGANLSFIFDALLNKSSSNGFIIAFGYRYDPIENLSIIGEFYQSFGATDTDIFSAIFIDPTLSIALRFRSEHLSWEIGAMRPLTDDLGDLIAIPILKGTYYFY